MFIGALWSPARKGLSSWLSFVMSIWLSFVMSICEFVTFPLYPGSGVVYDCIDF